MVSCQQAPLAVSDWIDQHGLENAILIVLFAVIVASLGLLLLTLRDTHGRFSLRLLLMLTTYVAVAVCAVTLFFRVVYRPI